MTVVVTEEHATVCSDSLVMSDDGLRHYAILVDAVPPAARFDSLRDKTPFYVALCDLCDAYDAAKGWYDFTFPVHHWRAVDLQYGFPTCAKCSGA